jgi:hypothetical protein
MKGRLDLTRLSIRRRPLRNASPISNRVNFALLKDDPTDSIPGDRAQLRFTPFGSGMARVVLDDNMGYINRGRVRLGSALGVRGPRAVGSADPGRADPQPVSSAPRLDPVPPAFPLVGCEVERSSRPAPPRPALPLWWRAPVAVILLASPVPSHAREHCGAGGAETGESFAARRRASRGALTRIGNRR